MQVVGERDTPHGAPRRQARCLWRQSAAAMLVFEQRDVRCDLAMEFALGVMPTEDVE